MEQSDNIPTWNLDGIFRSTDSDEYTAYLASCRESMTNITSLLESADAFTRKGNENFDFAAWLASFLQEYERAVAMSGTLCNYAYIVYSTDTTNPDRLNALNVTIDLNNSLRASGRRLALVLASHQKGLPGIHRLQKAGIGKPLVPLCPFHRLSAEQPVII